MKDNGNKHKRVRIGDVFEFRVDDHYVYAQYTHDDALLGEVLQMPVAKFENRPEQWPPIGVMEKTAFCTAIGSMTRAGFCSVIGNFPLVGEYAMHPLMVSGSPEEGAHQWLWDGTHLTEPGPSDVLKGLPSRSAIGYPVLLRRVSSFPITSTR